VKQDEQDLGADGAKHAGKEPKSDQVELVGIGVGQDSKSTADNDSDEVGQANGGSSDS